MRILILGSGSIGKRHQANAERLGHEVVVYDPPLGLEPPLEGDAAIVCSPSYLHLTQSQALITEGIPCMVEKPVCLPEGIELAKSLWALCVEQNVPIMAAHNIAWNREWRKFAEACMNFPVSIYTARWSHSLRHVLGNRTDSYQRHRWQGGGVILDCIQHIALALDIVGPVTDIRAKGRDGGMTEDCEDIAFIYGQHEHGTVMWQFDYLRPGRICLHEAYSEDGIAVWLNNNRAASDKSYRDELAAFLYWVKMGVPPEILADPWPSMEVAAQCLSSG